MGTTLLILLTHFIADFVCQTDKMALNKSKSNFFLSLHVLTYTGVLLVITGFIFGWSYGFFAWIVLNAGLHWATDYGTSRLTSYLWVNERRHWFFVAIGADQMIHYTCLLLTYQWIIE